MAMEIWIEPAARYKAAGNVTNGKMTGATVDDNNGITVDRDRNFESKAEFFAWARRRTR